MTITERIFTILSQNKLSQKDFAKIIDVNEKTVSAWKKNNSLPPLDKISNISDCLGVSIDYLLTGKEKSSSTNILKTDEQELIDIYQSLSTMNKGRLRERAEMLAELEKPVANETVTVKELEEQETIFIEFSNLKVSAGAGEPLIDDSYPDFIEVKKSELTENANFAVKINGKSMMPHFKDGDVVLVRSQPYVNVGEIGIFIIDGNGYIKERGDDRLISINPAYEDFTLKKSRTSDAKDL